MYNKVGLLVKNNKTRIFVDGVELRRVSAFDVHRHMGQNTTTMSVEFECDLDTAEQKKDRVIINECDYEELQKLATPLQEWLLKHCSAMYAIRIDSERVVIVADEVSAPFGDK